MKFKIIKRDYVPATITESYTGRPIKQYKAFLVQSDEGESFWATMEDIRELDPHVNFTEIPDMTITE